MVTTGYTERSVLVRELKLNYQEWGDPSNPTILALHGFGLSGHMFDEFADRAQDRFHIIALDQRGHGDSDWSPEGDYSRDAFVTDVEEFRKALGLERFVLMGHSMGGLNAVFYTNRYPEHVEALILVDVGPEAVKEGVDNIKRFTRGPDELEFEQFVEMAHRFNPRRSVENIRERMSHRLKQLPNGKWTWKFDKRFREDGDSLRVGSELSTDEMWAAFRAVPVPTLLIRGAESDVLSQDVAERAATEMRQARFVVIPGAGHSVPGDNPDAFTEAVVEFIRDVQAGRFPPPAEEEPETLDERVQANGRRGSLTPLALAILGVAAVAVAGAVVLGMQKKRSRARRIARLRELDAERARREAARLTHDVAVKGRRGVRRLRSAARDVDIRSARELAGGIAERLSEAPKAAARAVEKAEPRALKKRSRGLFGRGRGMTLLGLAAAWQIAGLLRGQAKRRKKRGRRFRWR